MNSTPTCRFHNPIWPKWLDWNTRNDNFWTNWLSWGIYVSRHSFLDDDLFL